MDKAPRLGLARRSRPQLFTELVGQEAVAVTLANAVSSGRTAHAYLFFGPRGVGKTTSARILAKALNCAQGPTPEPCGKCDSCVEIAAGTSIDVLELDAASNTQVDKIREMIIETVALAPTRDRRKVFIIDEVHMLSTSSFNALLKTLEEPPAHVVFILATTELAKLPATIVSRCQRFRFRPLARETVAAHLKRLAAAEGISAEAKALELAARACGGSLRDAVSLLDQASAYAGGKVTVGALEELLGILPEELLSGVLAAVLGKDAPALAAALARLAAEGHDPTGLLRDLRARLQEMYLHRLGAGPDPGPPWAALAAPHSPETFSFLLGRVNRTLEEMRGSDSQQIAFELGLFGMLEAAYDLAQWVERLAALEKRLSGALPAAVQAPVDEKTTKPTVEAGKSTDAAPERAWPAVLDRLQETKPILVGCLVGCRVLAGEAGVWRLVFDQRFKMEKAEASRTAIEEAAAAVSGAKPRLRFELGPAAPAKKAPEEGWVDANEAPPEDPAVQKALGVFGGKVRHVKKAP